jgi:hypothetical protein
MSLPSLLVNEGKISTSEQHTINLLKYLKQSLLVCLVVTQIADVDRSCTAHCNELVVNRKHVLIIVESLADILF